MVRFSEIRYQRPDMEALRAAVEEATRKVREAGSAAEVRDAYLAVQEKEKDADTMFTVCHVRNTIDTTDAFYDSEMKWLREAMARTIPQFTAWQKALAESPFRATRSQPVKMMSIFPIFICREAILSHWSVVVTPALFNSKLVSLAPCSSGRVSSQYTCMSVPAQP